MSIFLSFLWVSERIRNRAYAYCIYTCNNLFIFLFNKQNTWLYLVVVAVLFSVCFVFCIMWTANGRPVNALDDQFSVSVPPLLIPISQQFTGYSVCASAFRLSVVMSFNLNGFALADDLNHGRRKKKPKPKPIRFMHELSLNL